MYDEEESRRARWVTSVTLLKCETRIYMKLRTYVDTPKEITRNWHLVDVSGKVLGRITPKIAKLLMGKHKPTYTPNMDGGDHVVVINATKVAVTGNKAVKKMYYRHSGIPGG